MNAWHGVIRRLLRQLRPQYMDFIAQETLKQRMIGCSRVH